MVGSGALMGGFGSEITGGNFWDGVRNGVISSGLNHLMHRSTQIPGGNPETPMTMKDFFRRF